MSKDEENKTMSQEERELYDLVHGGITLNVEGVGNGKVLEHSSVFLSWKFSKELVEKISQEFREFKCKTVTKLLVVYWSIGKLDGRRRNEHRVICDITDPMVTLNFTSPGKNRIVVLIVTRTSEARIRNSFLRVGNGYYDSHVITRNEIGLFTETPGCGCIDVEIPEGLFAKRPRDWDFVNKMFDSPPRDQWAFRWRRILAYPSYPFCVILAVFLGSWKWLIGLGMISLFLLFGCKGIDYRILRHPRNESFDYIYIGISGSVFVPKIKGFYVPIYMMFNPVFLLAFALLVIYGYKATAVISAISVSLLLVGITAVPLLLRYWTGKQTKAKSSYRQTKAQARFEHNLSGLSEDARPTKVSDLPFRPRTFHFFYEDMKRKMCRGFSS